MQTELTNAQVQVQIAESQGEADLARARKQAEQTIVIAEAELARSRRAGRAERSCWPRPTASERMLAGRGESQRVMQVGLSRGGGAAAEDQLVRRPAAVRRQRSGRAAGAQQAAAGAGAAVHPDGGNGDETSPQAHGLLGTLLSLLVAEKSGFQMPDRPEPESLKTLVDQMSDQAVDNMRHGSRTARNVKARRT